MSIETTAGRELIEPLALTEQSSVDYWYNPDTGLDS
jgi:hypothetical protein